MRFLRSLGLFVIVSACLTANGARADTASLQVEVHGLSSTDMVDIRLDDRPYLSGIDVRGGTFHIFHVDPTLFAPGHIDVLDSHTGTLLLCGDFEKKEPPEDPQVLSSSADLSPTAAEPNASGFAEWSWSR